MTSMKHVKALHDTTGGNNIYGLYVVVIYIKP